MPMTVMLVYCFGPLRQWWQVRQWDDNSDGFSGKFDGGQFWFKFDGGDVGEFENGVQRRVR